MLYSVVCASSVALLAATGAFAESARKRAPRPISIEAQPLKDGLAELARRTGLRVRAAAEAIEGRRASGVADATSAEEALAGLLAGTGLVFTLDKDSEASVYDIVRTQAARETTTLEDINVEGDGGRRGGPNATGYGPADGFVASRSLTATKTDTPLIETPQSIAIITADQIKAQGAQSLGSTLRYSAGMTGEVFGPDTRGFDLQVRGFNVGDELFFRDGLRMSASEFSSFLPLDPYGAERIEVLRGPSSVLYGQTAPAGILNYVSKRPTDVAFGEISGSYGSFGRFQGEFDIGGPAGSDGVWSYRLTGLARDGETQVDHFADDRVFIAPAVTYRPSEDTTLTVLGNYQKDVSGYAVQFLPAFGTLRPKNGRYISDSLNSGEPGDHYRLEQASIGYLFEHRFSDAVTVRQNARYAWLENDQRGAYGVGGYVDAAASDQISRIADFGHSTLNSFAVDNQAQVKFDTGSLSHTFLGGAEIRYGTFKDRGGEASIDPIDVFNPIYGAEPGRFTLYQDTVIDQLQTGFYVQDQIKFGRWALTLGGRYDMAETRTDDKLDSDPPRQKDTAFTGRAGLVYLFDNGLAPYVSYSESFFPTIGQGAPGTVFKPETGVQYEGGVKFQPPGWNSFVTAAVFDLTRENVVRNIGNDAIQGGAIGSRGFELEGVASLKSGWNASLAYARIDATFKTTDDFARKGDTPLSVPKDRFSAWLDRTIKTGALEGLGAGVGVRVNGWTWGNDANTFKVPAFALFDAMVSYQRGGYRLQINGTNLFDNRHVAGCFSASQCFYGEARKVIAKLTYSWGGPSPVTPAVVKY